MVRCHCCGKELPFGSVKYVIEVKSFADFDGYIEEFAGDVEEGINELIESIEQCDPKNLEDDVYEEFIYLLCKQCRDRFANDPFNTGRPMFREEAKGTVH